MAASIAELRAALVAVSVPGDAEPMSAYVKHRYSFLGVKTPARRVATKPIIAESKQLGAADVIQLATQLRAEPEREFHYAASDLLRANATRLKPAHLSAVRTLAEVKPWWDLIDPIAIDVVGPMVRTHPELVEEMDEWVHDPNFWVARIAILHQLKFKQATDVDRLFQYALTRAHDTEFFVRKAIGWALRQYARTDADAVRTFIDRHHEEFSSLTVREASKHL